MEQKQNGIVGYIAIGILVVGIAGFAGYSFISGQSGQGSSTTGTQQMSGSGTGETVEDQAQENTGDMAADELGDYADGEYSATGFYTSPAGQESVVLDVTLADGVITDVAFEGQADNDVSIKFQSQFSDGYKDMVVGKNIDDVSLDKVSGSSLTSGGFNEALDQIKSQAQG